jgi:hypothetical protein
MATFTERTQNITQLLAVLCGAGAVARGGAACAVSLNGVAYADLLIALQLDYPAVGWDSVRLDATIAYMRARGMVVFTAGLYYLNYTMQRLGGANLCWARLCPAVEQPTVCIGVQTGKYVDMSGGDPCAALDNPANGCCPPLAP